MVLREVWVSKMEDFSGFEGSGRDIVLAEPRPFESVAC